MPTPYQVVVPGQNVAAKMSLFTSCMFGDQTKRLNCFQKIKFPLDLIYPSGNCALSVDPTLLLFCIMPLAIIKTTFISTHPSVNPSTGIHIK